MNTYRSHTEVKLVAKQHNQSLIYKEIVNNILITELFT
jgi:hypothetical protein